MKATVFPSGDQTGAVPPSNVMRELAPRRKSMSQISPGEVSFLRTARRCPSGESQGSWFLPGVFTMPLEALLARVREIAWIDARLEEEPRKRLDAAERAQRCVESLRLRRPELPAFRVTAPTGASRPFVH